MMDKTEFDCEECQTTVCCDDDVYLNLYQEKNICTYCRNNKQYVPGYTGIDGLICSMKSNWFSVTNYDLLDEFLGEHLWCGEKSLHQDLEDDFENESQEDAFKRLLKKKIINGKTYYSFSMIFNPLEVYEGIEKSLQAILPENEIICLRCIVSDSFGLNTTSYFTYISNKKIVDIPLEKAGELLLQSGLWNK